MNHPEENEPATIGTAGDLRKRLAWERRYEGYAVKFCVETHDAPTNENLARVLAHCARPPRAEWLPNIRRHVDEFRRNALVCDRPACGSFAERRVYWTEPGAPGVPGGFRDAVMCGDHSAALVSEGAPRKALAVSLSAELSAPKYRAAVVIRQAGTIESGQGIPLRVARALERAGLVAVDEPDGSAPASGPAGPSPLRWRARWIQ